MVSGDLLLHQRLVLLQVSQSLLQVKVLLALGSNSLVIDLTHVLETGHQVRHVVRVHRVQLVPHRFNLGSVSFDLLFVLKQLLFSFGEEATQVVYVDAHSVGVGAARPHH